MCCNGERCKKEIWVEDIYRWKSFIYDTYANARRKRAEIDEWQINVWLRHFFHSFIRRTQNHFRFIPKSSFDRHSRLDLTHWAIKNTVRCFQVILMTHDKKMLFSKFSYARQSVSWVKALFVLAFPTSQEYGRLLLLSTFPKANASKEAEGSHHLLLIWYWELQRKFLSKHRPSIFLMIY